MALPSVPITSELKKKIRIITTPGSTKKWYCIVFRLTIVLVRDDKDGLHPREAIKPGILPNVLHNIGETLWGRLFRFDSMLTFLLTGNTPLIRINRIAQQEGLKCELRKSSCAGSSGCPYLFRSRQMWVLQLWRFGQGSHCSPYGRGGGTWRKIEAWRRHHWAHERQYRFVSGMAYSLFLSNWLQGLVLLSHARLRGIVVSLWCLRKWARKRWVLGFDIFIC